MAPPMKRGANVALTQEIPSLTGVVLGVRWNAGSEQTLSDNLVAATILCNAQSQGAVRRIFRVLQPVEFAGYVGRTIDAGPG